jgi:hypothetical protein
MIFPSFNNKNSINTCSGNWDEPEWQDHVCDLDSSDHVRLLKPSKQQHNDQSTVVSKQTNRLSEMMLFRSRCAQNKTLTEETADDSWIPVFNTDLFPQQEPSVANDSDTYASTTDFSCEDNNSKCAVSSPVSRVVRGTRTVRSTKDSAAFVELRIADLVPHASPSRSRRRSNGTRRSLVPQDVRKAASQRIKETRKSRPVRRASSLPTDKEASP